VRFVVGYTMDTMYFTWLDNPVDVEKDLQLPQFFLVKTPKYDCSQNYTAGRTTSVSDCLSYFVCGSAEHNALWPSLFLMPWLHVK